MTISEKVDELIDLQLKEWQLAAKNYDDLKSVKLKTLIFHTLAVKVQFNSARIISSSANIDKQVIEKRACFLCEKNRPTQQREIAFGNSFSILLNPFPIFEKHLTIAHKNHVPQLLVPYFVDMLNIAQNLPNFTIFYNGATSGASAPDHFHFQAGNKFAMPLDSTIDNILVTFGKLQRNSSGTIHKVDDGLRKFFVFRSQNISTMVIFFEEFFKITAAIIPFEEEPQLNVHASFSNGIYTVLLFLRNKHRPWQYYETGEKNIMLSPASVDVGGLLVMPLEKDFHKITQADVYDIFQQIFLPEEIFEQINF